MRRCLLVILCLLLPLGCLAARTPTTLRVVDLRWIAGQPELETWLGCVQGLVNRQDRDTVVFLIRTDTDAAWANVLVQTYGLKKETFSPGALLEAEKAKLTGQVLYDPAESWTRNIALTAAAVQPGAVVATDSDLGVPTVLDTRKRWKDRLSAYTWAIDQYVEKANMRSFVLAPESGHLLADFITTQQFVAVDLSPQAQGEHELLAALIKRYPERAVIYGAPDDRTQIAPAMQQLETLLQTRGDTLTPVCNTSNLSCFARFPHIRPLQQGRDEVDLATIGEKPELVLIYGAPAVTPGGTRSLDYASDVLWNLLADPAMTTLPVGVEVPVAVQELAPAMYQAFIARQRMIAAELIAAPADGFLANTRRTMDLTTMSLVHVQDQERVQQTIAELVNAKWLGAFTPPALAPMAVPNFLALPAKGSVSSPTELRAALANAKVPFQVLYLDPLGISPETLHRMLPEISRSYAVVTPSQAMHAMQELAYVIPYLKAQVQQGSKKPTRAKPTLQLAMPATTVTEPTAAAPIPVSVRITGVTPVLNARLEYYTPDGRLGSIDLQEGEDGVWNAVLPPMLVGGSLVVRARVVEQNGFGVSLSPPLTLAIPQVDRDNDGADDTLELYQGSDPGNPDTDRDGLPDGLDNAPTTVNRDVFTLMPPLIPSADAPMLTDAGGSTIEGGGRMIPAGKAITYRIPVKDIPAALATLQVTSAGPGTVALNGGAPRPLETLPAEQAVTDVSLANAQPLGTEITVTLTAGAKPLCVLALEMVTNPDGPYILPAHLSPSFPFAGLKIPVEVTVYAPDGIKSVRLRYGASPAKLATLELKPIAGTGGVIFGGDIPRQEDATTLIYGVEAEDRKGRIAAGPYNMTPIGRTRKHTAAILGTRDLQGDWMPVPIWGDWGRVLTQGTGTDTHTFLTRPGTYTAWILASPRERGIGVTIERRTLDLNTSTQLLSRMVTAGAKDGWYKLGTFTTDESTRVKISVTPTGERGYCAYGEIVLTQDSTFVPVLSCAGIDWFNNVKIGGLADGQTVSGTITVPAYVAGNIDTLTVTADQIGGNTVRDLKTYVFKRTINGSFELDTRGMSPGVYRITITGWRVVTERGRTERDALISTDLTVTLKP